MSIGLAHLNCRELVELVTAYLEGDLSAGERKRFRQTGDAGGNVHVYWCLGSCGDTEHGEQLISRCRRRVWKPCADVDRALAETNLDAFRDLANLRR